MVSFLFNETYWLKNCIYSRLIWTLMLVWCIAIYTLNCLNNILPWIYIKRKHRKEILKGRLIMYATPCLERSCSISNQAKYKINSDFPCNNPKIIWYLLLSTFYIDYQISCAYYHSNDLNCIIYATQCKILHDIHFMDIELFITIITSSIPVYF